MAMEIIKKYNLQLKPRATICSAGYDIETSSIDAIEDKVEFYQELQDCFKKQGKNLIVPRSSNFFKDGNVGFSGNKYQLLCLGEVVMGKWEYIYNIKKVKLQEDEVLLVWEVEDQKNYYQYNKRHFALPVNVVGVIDADFDMTKLKLVGSNFEEEFFKCFPMFDNQYKKSFDAFDSADAYYQIYKIDKTLDKVLGEPTDVRTGGFGSTDK